MPRVRRGSANGERMGHVSKEGALIVKLLNKTGANSVKGESVAASTTTDMAVQLVAADIPNSIGKFYESGVPDGEMAYVELVGVGHGMIMDGTTSTRGYWVKVSDTDAGRVDATNASPPGGTIVALEDHLSETGHCLESKTSGTNVVAKMIIHHN